MDKINNSAKFEALLFVAGEEGLSLTELSSISNLSLSACQEQILKLNEDYATDKNSAFTIIQTAGRFRLSTKEDLGDLLKTYAKSTINQSLSRSAQDVLAIIAYKQPITRLEIDNYRSVSSSGVLTTLRSLGLIDVVGQVDAPGRPSLYATTDFFLDYLGINTLEDLPAVDEIELQSQDDNVESSLFGNLD
ncbi:SMC-Scp complex subunit ScpB [Lactovum miscens]|uniref:Segregation and condensation protein B n=1 Tax=Lactovum miscens TaxID=190387 RepID=A0A841C816_9LACT|nr:SMC-Scp complex subunit ScpB [Lactovum miscens]MBB5888447.1 segregation and condensation protein B [Lactovum miscens]